MSSILTLYHGGGASGWSYGELAYPEPKASKLFKACSTLLDKDFSAQTILESGNFELRHGINDFSDEFYVLIKRVDLDEFLKFQDEEQFSGNRVSYSNIARAFGRLNIYVRFIGVELLLVDEISPVKAPEISNTSAPAVAAALSDAEALIQAGNCVGAIDRVHTALHGYARTLCLEAGLTEIRQDIELPRAIKVLRESHPKLRAIGPHSEHFEKVLKAISVICDTLGTLRNHASLAHANDDLLGQSEALLVANTARTILRYLSDKIGAPQ